MSTTSYIDPTCTLLIACIAWNCYSRNMYEPSIPQINKEKSLRLCQNTTAKRNTALS